MVAETVVGLDLGKRSSQWVAVNRETGAVLQGDKLPNDREAVKNWLTTLPRPIRVVFEACPGWQPAYDMLEELVEELQMAHPLETRAIAHARIKTDELDAATLAHLGRADLVPQAWIAPRPVRDLREDLRNRAFLVAMQTRVKNRIHAMLTWTGTTPPAASDLFGKAGMAFLEEVRLRDPYQHLLNQHVRVLKSLREEIEEATGRIKEMARLDPRVELLLPIRGMGEYTVMLVLAEIGEIGRFPTPRHLVSYAGLCPSTYQSGQTLRHGRLIKRGSRWLRWAMVEAAIHYAKDSGPLGDTYRRIQRRKGNKIARIVVAREICQAVFWCLHKRHAFVQQSRRVQGRSFPPLSPRGSCQ